jgi:hypothetical protein
VAALTLKELTAMSGKFAWFVDCYKAGTQREHDANYSRARLAGRRCCSASVPLVPAAPANDF